MRFCDFFISYKIGLKNIKNSIPFTKLPLYRKIAVIATFAITIVSVLLFMFHLFISGLIGLGIGLVALAIFIIIDSRKSNLEYLLKQHYSPYSKRRMSMVIDILHEYEIDIQNSNAIDLLIEETKQAQIQSDYLLPLKNPFKALTAIIIPIIVYVAEKIGDVASQEELIIMATQVIVIILLVFSLILSLTPIIKDILYRDYNKYNELLYDLRQIKLFYTTENSASSNKEFTK